MSYTGTILCVFVLFVVAGIVTTHTSHDGLAVTELAAAATLFVIFPLSFVYAPWQQAASDVMKKVYVWFTLLVAAGLIVLYAVHGETQTISRLVLQSDELRWIFFALCIVHACLFVLALWTYQCARYFAVATAVLQIFVGSITANYSSHQYIAAIMFLLWFITYIGAANEQKT